MVKTIFCYLVPNLSYKGGVTVSAQRGPTITIQQIMSSAGVINQVLTAPKLT